MSPELFWGLHPAPLQDLESCGMWEGSPSGHLPVRKAKPTSIPSRFCSVSRLCGVAVSQTISPSAPRPVKSPNWERERQMKAGHCLTRVVQG